MAPTAPSRVFISYARKDGAALAQQLQKNLNDKGFDAWLDTQRLHAGSVWSAGIESEIDSREVTLALLSPGSYTSEICRAEQLRALDKGNRVIPVLAVDHSDRPIFLYARQYLDFTNAADYSIRLNELIAEISGDATATLSEEYRRARVTYLTAPPRVANYLERPEALRALRDTLFAEDHRQPIALTALAGMGGIGKTVLAKALTDDEVVQRAFPDGIVWITAGKERKRDFIEEMREVAKAAATTSRATIPPSAAKTVTAPPSPRRRRSSSSMTSGAWLTSNPLSPTPRALASSSPPATLRSADLLPRVSIGQTCSILGRRVSYWPHGQISRPRTCLHQQATSSNSAAACLWRSRWLALCCAAQTPTSGPQRSICCARPTFLPSKISFPTASKAFSKQWR